MYLPEEFRFSYLMKLPEKSDIGKEFGVTSCSFMILREEV